MNTDPHSPLIDLFNSTSADFDGVSPQVWGRAGQVLVDALALTEGERVLDVCAGTGASAVPAAIAVGPTGAVVAVDFAGDLLAVADAKAAAAGLRNLTTVRADVTALTAGAPPCETPFDALACSYGVFFLPDMDAAMQSLMRVVRPGGRVGVTVWQADALRAFTEQYFAAVDDVVGAHAHHGPRAGDGPRPITRVDTEAKLADWFTALGAVAVSTSVLQLRVAADDEFSWAMVMGSGLRGALAGLDDAVREQIRKAFRDRLARAEIVEVVCDTVVAIATV